MTPTEQITAFLDKHELKARYRRDENTLTLIALCRELQSELHNIAVRGNNCECAAHGWAKNALTRAAKLIEGEK